MVLNANRCLFAVGSGPFLYLLEARARLNLFDGIKRADAIMLVVTKASESVQIVATTQMSQNLNGEGSNAFRIPLKSGLVE